MLTAAATKATSATPTAKGAATPAGAKNPAKPAAAAATPKAPSKPIQAGGGGDDAFSWFTWTIIAHLRVLSAVYAPIGDCDEVFNYWEPIHYVVYGTGLQTWEYSPTYALRSYLYIMMHASLIRVLDIVAMPLSVRVGPCMRVGCLCVGERVGK